MKDDVRNGQVLFFFHPCVEPLLSRLSFSLVPSLCIPEFKVDTRLAILSSFSLPARFLFLGLNKFSSLYARVVLLSLSRSLLPSSSSSSSLCPFIVTFLITQTSLAEGRVRENVVSVSVERLNIHRHTHTHIQIHIPGRTKRCNNISITALMDDDPDWWTVVTKPDMMNSTPNWNAFVSPLLRLRQVRTKTEIETAREIFTRTLHLSVEVSTFKLSGEIKGIP